MPFTVHAIYHQIFRLWRQRRFDLFLRLLRPRPSDILIDVGGFPWFWMSHPQPVKRIDSINLDPVSLPGERAPHYNIRRLIADGCSLPVPDNSYDIGFSNSVIEHVGSWDRQQQFASEIRRVARKLWVQTPAFACIIEPHYMTPFVHYLPRRIQKAIVRWGTVRGWLERPNRAQVQSMVDTTRLLRKSEMQRLFPDCQILIERMLWIIPKSYIAVRTEPNRQAGGTLVNA